MTGNTFSKGILVVISLTVVRKNLYYTLFITKMCQTFKIIYLITPHTYSFEKIHFFLTYYNYSYNYHRTMTGNPIFDRNLLVISLTVVSINLYYTLLIFKMCKTFKIIYLTTHHTYSFEKMHFFLTYYNYS